MKIKYALLFIIIFTAFGLNAQSSNESDSYYPLKQGMSKTLTWYKGKYRELVKDTISFNGKVYTHVAQIFSPKNTIDIHMRVSNDTVYYFNDVKKEHIPFFGINPKVGEIIGDGTIKKINAKLKTPKGKLSGLLVVGMNYSNGAKDTRYYQKGLGLVAVKNGRKLICYYVPD